MSSAKYLRFQATAKRLIKENGQPLVIYREETQAGTDPATLEPIPGTPRVEIPGDGVKLNYKLREIDGDNILKSDCKLLWNGSKPERDMLVDIDGETWSIVDIDPIQPAGVEVMFTLQLRR